MRGANRTTLSVIGATAAGCVAVIATFWLASAPRDVSAKSSFAERAARRAYDGAPPVIPHAPLGADCVRCHAGQAIGVPHLGMAPPMPHGGTDGPGRFARCRQCHVFARETGTFVASGFEGTVQTPAPGERLYPAAPPVVPHGIFMREACLTCHSGPAAREEIRCTHPERPRCLQCHAIRRVP